MHNAQRSRNNVKNTFIPKRLATLSSLLKKRATSTRTQGIKTELAARTLYVVDGDDIIITSLDRKPFCCQEELSVMSRSELCRVARELNQKLPGALRIEPLLHMSTGVIRFRIEEMMGFRHLQKRVRMLAAEPQPIIELGTLLSHQVRKGKRSPTSSFSSASSRSSAPYGLAVVNEMDEESNELFAKKNVSVNLLRYISLCRGTVNGSFKFDILL